MADITVSYDEMRNSVNQLKQGQQDIEGKLQSMKTMIKGLVETAFRTQSASPRFKDSYEQWDQGAMNVIAGLEGMSQFLEQAIASHQDLDSNLSSGLGG